MTDTELYRDIILDHSENPRHKHALPDANAQARGYNPLCGDDITVYLKVDGDRIAAAAFTGQSCAICQASASMLTEIVAGRRVDEVDPLVGTLQAMLKGEAVDTTELGDAEALRSVGRLPIRVKCATLSWHALQAALLESGAVKGG